MFHLLVNFCLFIFVCYAVAGPVRAILFGGRKKTKRAMHRSAAITRAVPKRTVSVRRKAPRLIAKKQAKTIYLQKAA